MSYGYVPFSREHLHNGMLRNHKLWAFWSWCLLKASYKNHSQVVGNQIINLGPGQFIFGRKKASEELGLTETSLRTIIKNLEKSQNLTIKTTNKFSIITIVNWDSYEAANWENNQQTNQQLTNNQPTTNQQLTTNNKGNNGNKGKKGEGECRGEMTHREQPQAHDGQRLPAVLTENQLGDDDGRTKGHEGSMGKNSFNGERGAFSNCGRASGDGSGEERGDRQSEERVVKPVNYNQGDHDGNFYGISGEFRGGAADLGDGSEGDQSFSNGDEERIHRRPAHRDSQDVRGEELGIRNSRERVGKQVNYNLGDHSGAHDSDARANAFEDYGTGKTAGCGEVQDGEPGGYPVSGVSGGSGEGAEDLGAGEGDRLKQKSNKWPERFTQVRREIYPEPGETMRGEGPDDFGAEEGRPGDGSQLSGHGGQVEFLPGGAEEEDLRSGIFPGTIQRRTREVEDNSGPEGSGEVRLGPNERSLPDGSRAVEGVPGGIEEGQGGVKIAKGGIKFLQGAIEERESNVGRAVGLQEKNERNGIIEFNHYEPGNEYVGSKYEREKEIGIAGERAEFVPRGVKEEGIRDKARVKYKQEPGSLEIDNSIANHPTLHADIKSSNVGGKTALKKPRIEPNEEAVRLATWLADDLLSDDGKHQNLINGKKMPTIMKWAADIDKINRIDKRPWPVIEHVLKEARVHHFWRRNIESGAKLRKQFSRLYLETDGRRAEKKVDQPKKKEPTKSCYDCMGYQTKRCQNITSNMSACGKYATLEEISQVMVTDEPF